jgi:predicted nucleic acid-binding protein
MKNVPITKVKYFDTSAIVKYFIDEKGSKNIRNYFGKNTNFCCTEMTFYEAMNVLKARLFNKGEKIKYLNSIVILEAMRWHGEIEIETIRMDNLRVLKDIEKIAVKYDIDFGDAVQIYAILEGKYKRLTGDSKTTLITADEKLEKTAVENKIRVWNCNKQDKPQW